MIAAALAIVVAALLLLAWSAQERIAYQPPRSTDPVPPGAERVEYAAEDGQPLFALVIPPPDAHGGAAPPRVILAFHGNADLAVWMAAWGAETARRTGATVVVAEYRGYGGLPGRPSADGIRRDARAAFAFVRRRFGAGAHLAYFGHSLGSAVATELAMEHPPQVLVLESPFTSARDMAAAFGTPLLRWLWPVIGRIPYDTRARVGSFDVPVWVVHGDRDVIVPTRLGRAVFAAARRPGELLIVQGAGHNDVAAVGGDEYWHWIQRAFR